MKSETHSSKLKCAVIGVGVMGKNHVRTYSQIQKADLVAISDTRKTLVEGMAEEFGCRAYEDFRVMLDKEKPELVSVCVPTSAHFSVAKECLERGIHVLLEKPIAMNEEEARALLELADRCKVQLLVGHIERFNPAIQKLKTMLKKGDLGRITNIMARRVGGFPPQIKDANIAVDLAIHDIDIVNFILEELPLEVSSSKRRYHIEGREDSVEFFLKYKDCSAYVQANWITPVKIRKLNITCTEGYLELDYINQRIELYQSNYEKFREEIGSFSDYILRFSEPDKTIIEVAKKEPLKEELSYMISCIRNGTKVDSTFALEALRIALK